ncbi:hypothetical protein F5Y15DRAFT_393075 [Xylariaceae sp. FL0016]|nr:hypothetical protein F5Y15DRAFT_393075 [Xylariaceae sp. FL0016]
MSNPYHRYVVCTLCPSMSGQQSCCRRGAFAAIDRSRYLSWRYYPTSLSRLDFRQTSSKESGDVLLSLFHLSPGPVQNAEQKDRSGGLGPEGFTEDSFVGTVLPKHDGTCTGPWRRAWRQGKDSRASVLVAAMTVGTGPCPLCFLDLLPIYLVV